MDRLNWVTQECFNAIAQLSRVGPHEGVQPSLVHARMRAYVESVQTKAREAGYTDQEGRLMAYAMAAFADEVAMANGLRDFWSVTPLQLVIFGENVAGEQFFAQLERVRQNGQLDVLRVYYLCLLFGFQGRYSVRGANVALSDLLESVRTQLLGGLAMPEVLAPNGPRPEEGTLGDLTSHVPVVWLGAGLFALSSVLYLGLAVALRDRLQQFVSFMTSLAG